ncbi:MAG: putative transporter [Proteobacteria bacterium]|nr:putative transporter [Pseudomonadota bacterium]
MTSLLELARLNPVAHAVLVLACVVALGLALGSVKVKGIGLGAAGVLFVGILCGHLQFTLAPDLLAFVRDFGLVLFVYTIGLQVGPGFVTSLRQQGLPLNLMAAGIVLLGAGVTVLVAKLLGVDMAAAVGIFTGATTNTPALGAAQEALKSLPGIDADRLGLPALGYAVAYPFGILGIILAMLALRWALRVDIMAEAESFRGEQRQEHEPVERRNILITNPNFNGLHLHQLPAKDKLDVVISRVKHLGETEAVAAGQATILHAGDLLLVVGTRTSLDEFCLIAGKPCAEDLMLTPGRVTSRRVVVTQKEMLGQSLRELQLNQRYGVTLTRVTRGDVELSARADLRLKFGDMVQMVGEEEDIVRAAEFFGNSVKELNHTNLIPVFVGIVLGVMLGMYPFQLGTMPTPVRLGLAGGPLLVAIILSRIGRIGPLLWYMPANANTLLRELGITLFLACAGLKAGEHFFHVLREGDGLKWMACGAVITLLPLLIVGAGARLLGKLNYLNLCGLLSGSMTDPPALAFANTVTGSDAPSVAYATVYPLTMLLRIVVAQLLVLFFCG